MCHWIFILFFYIATMIPLSTSNGKFYVGFLGYKNKDNLNMDGKCCDGTMDARGRCEVTCDLMFQVSVYGLDGGNMTNKRPSRLPINDTNTFMFSDEYKDAVNPITFDFKKWPGQVVVVVQVFDQDHVQGSSNNTLEPVDEMDYPLALLQSTSYFTYRNITGSRAISPSKIMMLFRYECGPTYYGSDCLTDCLMFPSSPVCPRTTTLLALSTASTRQSTEPLTPLTDCTSTSTPDVGHSDFTTESTTETSGTLSTHYSTSGTLSTHYSTSAEVTIEVTTVEPSTETTDMLSTTDVTIEVTTVEPSTETTDMLSTTDAASSTSHSLTSETYSSVQTSTSVPITSTGIISTTSGAVITTSEHTVTKPQEHSSSTSQISGTINTEKSSSLSSGHPTSPTVTQGTSQKSRITTVHSSAYYETTSLGPSGEPTKDPKDFALSGDSNNNLAIILGCVLGGLLLIAIVIFVVYQNRQKRIQKRQEIYNVSPEVISIVEENGTTERSDVPITTSPL